MSCIWLHFLGKEFIVSHVKSSVEVLSLLFKFIIFLDSVFFHKNLNFQFGK